MSEKIPFSHLGKQPVRPSVPCLFQTVPSDIDVLPVFHVKHQQFPINACHIGEVCQITLMAAKEWKIGKLGF